MQVSPQSLILPDVFAEHTLFKTINSQNDKLPQIIFLTEYHETEQTRESKILEDQDRRINQAVIEKLYQPGDIVLVEQPADKEYDQAQLVQTKELKVRVKLLGWDDPVSRYNLKEICKLIYEVLPILMEEEYFEASKTPQYQEALATLNLKNDEFWDNVEVSFTKKDLPNPTMNDNSYWTAISKTRFVLEQSLYNLIETCFPERQHNLSSTIDSVIEKYNPGRIFVIGGYAHFQGRKNFANLKLNLPLGLFYMSLKRTGRFAAFFSTPNAMYYASKDRV